MASSSALPLIGIPVDFVDTRVDTGSFWYSEYPWYALGKRYADAVVKAGGVPILLCYNAVNVESYAHLLDGLVLAGISFDVDPTMYGESFRHKTTVTRPERTQFESAMAKRMLDLHKPVLGLTAGMQLINVLLGGSLYQHILEEIPNVENHTQNGPLLTPQHFVTISADSNFGKAVRAYDLDYAQEIQDVNGHFTVETNSYHHQSVKALGKGLRAVAWTKDGVIEAIESTTDDFCLGIQWNAEFLLSPVDYAIFQMFLEAVHARKQAHRALRLA